MDQQKTGALIARLRRSKKLTQAALGSRLGVTNKTVSRWETGRYLPDVETLRLLGSVLGVSMEELLAGETAPRPDTADAAVTPPAAEALDVGRQNSRQNTATPKNTTATEENAADTTPADERPPVPAPSPASFSLAERVRFWRRRWWRAHWPLAALGILGSLALLLAGIACRRPLLCAAAFALVFFGRLYLYNRRMAYIEAHAYGPRP